MYVFTFQETGNLRSNFCWIPALVESLGLEEAASSLCVCTASSQCMDGKSMLPGISYNPIAKPHLHDLFQLCLPPQRPCLQISSYWRLELECMNLGWGANLLHSNK